MGEEVKVAFSTLGRALFTVFRCLIGDCATTQGKPLVLMMTTAYGWTFGLGYTVVMMLVTFGLFNLIMAIYLENTLACAKSHDESVRGQKKEALRVAVSTKELLKKICAAQRAVDANVHLHGDELSKLLRETNEEDLNNVDIHITRDTFLLVVQDPKVQALLDDMDIQPEGRARLFD